ncbi:hypothetical protein CGRA01v4_11773 [Colletotrichum graminicola]|nr:hypothetical protein CGRA01v4_11773 [Colletotrichum graminicola]
MSINGSPTEIGGQLIDELMGPLGHWATYLPKAEVQKMFWKTLV